MQGHGHYAKDYGNKKKGKSPIKAITATWDNESDKSECESPSSDKNISKGVKSFMALNTSLSSLSHLNNSESEVEKTDEEEEDIHDAFDKLFDETREL